jgi:hypothetical protein
MGAPHNPARLGELWDDNRLAILLGEMRAIRGPVVVSGGWAWHFMTPAGHMEYRHAHDHKDIDLFVNPSEVAFLIAALKRRGYERTWTRFDGLAQSRDFFRYAKTVERNGCPVKVILDLFVEEAPFVEVGGYRVLEPSFLLAQYGLRHGSDQCFSVQIARKLLEQGISPVGRAEMANYEPFNGNLLSLSQ